jgi:deazaflavin-dependent oxidoreductase (nitroreductase family)
MSDWNAKTIAEFRANEGRVGGYFEGAPLVLVHHRGRKSGREYVTPTMYLPHDTEPDIIIYVFATKGGVPTNPDWYYNLTAAGDGSVERGTETYAVTVRELTGAERDRIYAELPRLCRVRTPNRWSPHHSCARTSADVAHNQRPGSEVRVTFEE